MCQGGGTNWFYKTCLWIAAAAVPTVLLALFLGHGTLAAGTAVILFVAVALGMRGTPLRGLSFTMWIIAADM